MYWRKISGSNQKNTTYTVHFTTRGGKKEKLKKIKMNNMTTNIRKLN